MSNTFGRILRFTSFGESHGEAVGGILDGMPAGIEIDFDAIRRNLQRRRPGQSRLTTSRNETDQVRFLSGIFEGKTLGTTVAFIIENHNTRPEDYEHLKDTFRPSHADFTYEKKYGIRDWRGGGRASARETAARVVAGSLAAHIIPGIKINAYVHAVGPLHLNRSWEELPLDRAYENPVRTPDPEMAKAFEQLILETKKRGDTLGGQIVCVIQNLPAGLGEPLFDKLQARLAAAMFSIPAVKGFEYGSGFEGTRLTGSQHNDLFNADGSTKTNLSGGIQGGISNGMPVYFKVAFKPVSTIMREQPGYDRHGNPVTVQGKGRHDPCVCPRAVPIVEAMTALTIADMVLLNRNAKI